uniref:Uncharacterized protein n=1 Tax=Candidatus Kentrum sp. MB TaxID=2138164 RepID=A0A450XVZ3_9GAMM|nr:MAG: hypothetical protein BECKMB1821I_GA0114274_104524 [Candidatus Kentron sp. MB]VFK76167.1 MAG: hypothetical protein BECKMB1821H_GA0114242_104424 [Candidatus Kentron sp. MB]
MQRHYSKLMENFFPEAYLTVIALIQGGVLALLVSKMSTFIMEDSEVPILEFLLSFGHIFIVWHHYLYGSFYFRWTPTSLDSLLPFLLGMSQYFSVEFLFHPETHYIKYSISFFYLFGSIAYIYAAHVTSHELFSNLMSDNASYHHTKNVRLAGYVAGGSTLFQSVFSFLTFSFFVDIFSREAWLFTLLLLLMAHIVIYELYYCGKERFHKQYILLQYIGLY